MEDLREDLRGQIENMEEFIAERGLWPAFETWLSLPPVKIQSPAEAMREEIPPAEAQRRVVQVMRPIDEICSGGKLINFADLIRKRKQQTNYDQILLIWRGRAFRPAARGVSASGF
jgi:hypothetical protein